MPIPKPRFVLDSEGPEAEMAKTDLLTLAELGELKVLESPKFTWTDKWIMIVEGPRGRRVVIRHYAFYPEKAHFRFTDRVDGPLRPQLRTCGDGVWNFSLMM